MACVLLAQPAAVGAQSAFSGAAAKQQVDALAGQIGSRPAGSAAYDQAVAYAEGQLQQCGLSPAVENFPVSVFEDRGSALDVSDPSGTRQHVDADTLQYSVGGQVHAPLVAAGMGQSEDFA